MIYEYKGVEIHSFYNTEDDFWTLPIDFMEEMGMLVPVYTRLQYTNRPGLHGTYSSKYNRVTLYRNTGTPMDVTFVHELVHAYQKKAGKLEERTKYPSSYEEYLRLPTEIEAFWWSNEYSKKIYGEEISVTSEYRELGVKEFL